MPYSKPLEEIAFPHERHIVEAVLQRDRSGGGKAMTDIVMPRLSDTMEEGTILRWLKQDGEHVARGEELVEIETDKANMTYESDLEGALQTVAREGDTLSVGDLIARIGAERGRGAACGGGGRRRGGGACRGAGGEAAMAFRPPRRRTRRRAA